MKQFIAFAHSYGKDQGIYHIYEWNEDSKWWFIKGTTQGFKVETVEANPSAFLYGDSEEELLKVIEEKYFIKKYGFKDKPLPEYDVECPRCGWKFGLDYMDYNDGYYTPGINEDHTTIINCICGAKLYAKVEEVIVKCSVKEI